MFETLFVQLGLPQVSVAANCHGNGRIEFYVGDFGLRLVVVDFVLGNDALLGGSTRLSGSQNNADEAVAEFLANPFDKLETGVVSLHDDVKENYRNTFFSKEDLSCLLRGIGVQKVDRNPVERKIPKDNPRYYVHFLVVVDYKELPRIPSLGVGGRLVVVGDEGDQLVVG